MLWIGRLHCCQTISEIRHHRVSAMYVQGDDVLVRGRQKMEVFLLQMDMDRNGDPPPKKRQNNIGMPMT